MASRIIMPKLTDSMEEGVVVKWRKSEGDHVESGDVLAEIETDKAVMDLEAFASGTLRKILVREGTTVPSGALIGVIAEPEEEIQALLKETPAPAEKAAAEKIEPVTSEAPVSESGAEATASPRVRTLAREHSIDLTKVKGSGPGGRIIERDLESFLTPPPQARSSVARSGYPLPSIATGHMSGVQIDAPLPELPPTAKHGVEAGVQEVPLSQMRKAVARITTQSKAPIPHFYVTIEVDMAEGLRIVEESKSSRVPVTINHLIIAASARALKQHPEINASFGGDTIRLYSSIDIGIAVGVEDGLIVPVLRDCGAKTLVQIAEEERALVTRTRNRELKPGEYTGATFLISNLGMYDIDNFIAVILPPAAAALAIGSVRDVPVVRDGRVEIGRRVKMTLASDHRVIDGVAAGKFLQTLKAELQQPRNS